MSTPSIPAEVTRARVVRSPLVLWRQGPFGVVVLGPEAPRPVTLAGTGAAVWNALGAEGTLDDLVVALADAYGADRAVVLGDVTPVVELLLRIGAYEVST